MSNWESHDGEHWRQAVPIGKVMLWHPESPGVRVIVRPSFWRRIGIVRSEFATYGEVLRMYREMDPRP